MPTLLEVRDGRSQIIVDVLASQIPPSNSLVYNWPWFNAVFNATKTAKKGKEAFSWLLDKGLSQILLI